MGRAVAQEGSTASPPLGFVTVETATVSGALEVTGDKAVVRGGGVITARDRTAALELNRGGTVNVCATSSLHVTAGSAVMARPPLLLALDRGAMEIHMDATARDVLITPDLRFSVAADGPLDLRVRVTPNGDTCVEHKGLQAPKLEIVDVFGDGHYELRAGQHVLFEHGSLREVVDRETSPCGCPEVPVVSVASSGATGARPAAPGGATGGLEAQHPFPAAESEGLTTESAAAARAPATPPGVPHAQVAATLAYGATGSSDGTGALPGAGTPGAGGSAAAPGDAATNAAAATSTGSRTTGAAPSSAPEPAAGTATGAAGGSGRAADTGSVSTGRAEAPPAPAPPGATDLAHRIGHFFRKIFGGG